MGAFDGEDDEDGEGDPPRVVRQLGAQLLPHEIRPILSLRRRRRRGGAATGRAPKGVQHAGGHVETFCVVAVVRVVGEDAEAALFVHVGVAHGDDDGVGGYVHHDYVEELQAYAQVGDGDDVEAAGADGEGLEEAVGAFDEGGKDRDFRIADLFGRLVGFLGGKRSYGLCGEELWCAYIEDFKGGPVDAVEG